MAWPSIEEEKFKIYDKKERLNQSKYIIGLFQREVWSFN